MIQRILYNLPRIGRERSSSRLLLGGCRYFRLGERTDNLPPLPLTLEDINVAADLIKDGVRRTNCDFSQTLSDLCMNNIYLKREYMQFTGSFKERGARYSLMCLDEDTKHKGVITASAGNHALALSWHGKQLDIPVRCIMPVNAPFTKVNRCERFGAKIEKVGKNIGESRIYAEENYKNIRYINGYDDKEICAGAGTIGIELLEQVPNADIILCPVGGCGLIAGVSVAAKALKPDIEIIGVEPKNVPSFKMAREAGAPVHGFLSGSLADGLAVPIVGRNSFTIANRLVNSVELVTEKMISLSMLRLIEIEKTVVEGGGAAALAAVLPGGPLHGRVTGKNIVVLLSGGNIDTSVLGRVIERGLAADGRLIKFSVLVSDQPGGLNGLTSDLASIGVSVKDILHERAWVQSRIDQVNVHCVVETTDREQARLCLSTLKKKYKVKEFVNDDELE